jgi:hypothetical protein
VVGGANESAADASDQLSLRIGRVARGDVALEFELRFLFLTLCLPTRAVLLLPRDFGAIHSAIAKMLKQAPLPPEWGDWQATAVALLDAIGRAHTERNRIVHDMWFPDEDGAWMRQAFERRGVLWDVTETQLDQLDALVAEQQRLAIRCTALTLGLQQLSHGGGQASDTRRDLLTAQDRFELLPDGGYRVLDQG